MASMAVSGIFNAFAFAGAGFLFSKLNHPDYEAEMHRHNLAQEKLRKAQEQFFEEQTRLKNQREKLRLEQHDADVDFNQTNKSLAYYKQELAENQQKLDRMRKPVLKDFYKPSEEMQHYQNLSGGIIAVAVGGLVYFFVRWDK